MISLGRSRLPRMALKSSCAFLPWRRASSAAAFKPLAWNLQNASLFIAGSSRPGNPQAPACSSPPPPPEADIPLDLGLGLGGGGGTPDWDPPRRSPRRLRLRPRRR
eukprot:7460913-Pyramimonas_sp.AAC.2